MQKPLALIFTSALFANNIAFAQILPFDSAYTVASVGSTVQVTTFDINGPAPRGLPGYSRHREHPVQLCENGLVGAEWDRTTCRNRCTC